MDQQYERRLHRGADAGESCLFAELNKKYGMRLDIYAWDAGNLDGAGEGYGNPDGEKLRAQYPRGYAPIAEYAAACGTRLGVWGGADGYGDTEEEAEKRRNILVSLCRDYRFGLFKFDTVCGVLRENKRKNLQGRCGNAESIRPI